MGHIGSRIGILASCRSDRGGCCTAWTPVPRKHRSKAFVAEEAALDWALTFVKDAGPPAHAYVYRHPEPENAEPDPVPDDYRVAWVDGAVSTMTWPKMPRTQREAWSRQISSAAFDEGASHAGPDWVPDWVRAATTDRRAYQARPASI